jgi:hypothetical protein
VETSVTLPPELSPVSALVNVSSSPFSRLCTSTGAQFVCSVEALQPGESAVIEVNANAVAPATVTASAQTTTTSFDPTLPNLSSVDVDIECPPQTPVWNGQQCEACDPNEVECNGQCVDNNCAPGDVFDTNYCVCHEDCTGGRQWDGSVCACPSGEKWSPISQLCDPDLVATGEVSTYMASSGYRYDVFTAPATAGAMITAKGMWGSDWYQAGRSLTQSAPYLIEVPFAGGYSCDHVWKHSSNNMVSLTLQNVDQSSTVTGSISVGPGTTAAIAGSDCYFPDNFLAHETVIWEARLQ